MTDSEVRELVAEVYPKARFRGWTRRQGHAHIGKCVFSLPEWIKYKPREYQVYYVLHELTHLQGYNGHGRDFKRAERRILKAYGIVPKYMRAYPRELYDLEGNLVYRRGAF